jgi:hypothetical protein
MTAFISSISIIPIALKYDPNSKSNILRSKDKVEQINKLNRTPVILSPSYLGYLTKEFLPKMLSKDTSEEEVMKKIGLVNKDEYKSTLIMMRQVQFSLTYLVAAMNDMKVTNFYHIYTADARGRVYTKAYLSHINAK